jgi:hypothetical protein
MCLGIGDVHHVVGIERDRGRPGQIDLESRTISIEPMLSGPDDRRDDAGLMVYFSDAITAGIADVEVVAGIERDVERQIEPGLSTEAFVAAVACFTDAGKVME